MTLYMKNGGAFQNCVYSGHLWGCVFQFLAVFSLSHSLYGAWLLDLEKQGS